jgi:hypothetical protein
VAKVKACCSQDKASQDLATELSQQAMSANKILTPITYNTRKNKTIQSYLCNKPSFKH